MKIGSDVPPDFSKSDYLLQSARRARGLCSNKGGLIFTLLSAAAFRFRFANRASVGPQHPTCSDDSGDSASARLQHRVRMSGTALTLCTTAKFWPELSVYSPTTRTPPFPDFLCLLRSSSAPRTQFHAC